MIFRSRNPCKFESRWRESDIFYFGSLESTAKYEDFGIPCLQNDILRVTAHQLKPVLSYLTKL